VFLKRRHASWQRFPFLPSRLLASTLPSSSSNTFCLGSYLYLLLHDILFVPFLPPFLPSLVRERKKTKEKRVIKREMERDPSFVIKRINVSLLEPRCDPCPPFFQWHQAIAGKKRIGSGHFCGIHQSCRVGAFFVALQHCGYLDY